MSARRWTGRMGAVLVMLGCGGLVPTVQAQTVIGIANLGPHPALTKVIEGFKAEMAREGYREGKGPSDVEYVYSDANFTQSMMPQMFSSLMSKRPKAILTVSTSVSQVARSAVTDPSVPLIFALVTDPVAAGLVSNWQHGSERFAGASDLQDFDAVVAFGKRLFPGATSFGTLYNPGEANDVVTTRELEAAAKRGGLAFKAISVDTVNDIPQRAQLLKGVGFVYITGSNLVQSAMPSVAATLQRLRVPILSSETEAIKTGLASASYAVSLQSVGANAAKIAVRALHGEKTVTLPVVKPDRSDYVISISGTQFSKLGLTLPPAFSDCKCFVN